MAEELKRRKSLPDMEAMKDAERLCVPCKLCGGAAKVTDAGPGYGYHIRCENSFKGRVKDACMIGETRVGGWAYNAMELWNGKHAAPTPSPVTGSDDVLAELVKLTFAVQHNPNCPAPWLVRLCGDGPIDMKPYLDVLGLVRHQTGDILGFGKTFEEAAAAAIRALKEGRDNG